MRGFVGMIERERVEDCEGVGESSWSEVFRGLIRWIGKEVSFWEDDVFIEKGGEGYDEGFSRVGGRWW